MAEELEIQSLIHLLDDPDKQVFEAVKMKLSKIGPEVIPYLEEAWENSLDELFQTRIENITQEIQFTDINQRLMNWAKSSEHNLLDGAMILAQYQFPDLDIELYWKEIEKIKKDIWLEINDQLTALEKVKIINHIFFEMHGFTRSSTFPNSVQSNFLNHILQTKKGSPISLAVLYAGLAQSLDLPVYGVALSKNFILCYKNMPKSPFDNELEDEVLFYINPFNKGVVFGKKEIELFIKQQKLENKKAYFYPCSNKETIAELIKLLIDFYTSQGEQLKVNNYKTLLKNLYF